MCVLLLTMATFMLYNFCYLSVLTLVVLVMLSVPVKVTDWKDSSLK